MGRPPRMQEQLALNDIDYNDRDAKSERCNLIRSGKGIGFPQGGHHSGPGSLDKEEGTEPADVFYTALGEALEVLLEHWHDLVFSVRSLMLSLSRLALRLT